MTLDTSYLFIHIILTYKVGSTWYPPPPPPNMVGRSSHPSRSMGSAPLISLTLNYHLPSIYAYLVISLQALHSIVQAFPFLYSRFSLTNTIGLHHLQLHLNCIHNFFVTGPNCVRVRCMVSIYIY